MSILLNNRPYGNIIQEAYAGKPKEFIEVEKRLQRIVDKIKKAHRTLEGEIKTAVEKKSDFKLADLYKSDDVVFVEKTLQNFFDFGDFCLNFYYVSVRSGMIGGGFTFPYTFKFFKTESPGHSTFPYTFKFFKTGPDRGLQTQKLMVGVNIDVLLIVYKDLSGEELLGVILHEIGHNMDTSIFAFLSAIPISISPEFMIKEFVSSLAGDLLMLGAFDILNFGNLFSRVFQDMNKSLEKNFPFLTKLLNVISMLYIEYKPLKSIINWIDIFRGLKVLDPTHMIGGFLSTRSVFGWAGEKYADSFATKYGYGPAIATTFSKEEPKLISKTIYEIPGLNWCYDLLTLFTRIILIGYDEHPEDIVRVNAQLLKLKRDAEDPDLNPRLRSELNSQIVVLQKHVDNCISISKSENKKRIFTWLYKYITVRVMHNIVDYREIFELIVRHEE